MPPIECPGCDGSGDCTECGGENSRGCDICLGTGDCVECDGSGEVVEDDEQ
jgi:hypothetical protein